MDETQRRNNISKIVEEYRFQLAAGWQPPTYGEFAAALSEPLKPCNRAITPQQVFDWENGRDEPGDSDLNLLWTQSQPNSWQWRLARDLRAAKHPEAHRASSPFARKLLRQPRRPGPKMPLPPDWSAFYLAGDNDQDD